MQTDGGAPCVCVCTLCLNGNMKVSQGSQLYFALLIVLDCMNATAEIFIEWILCMEHFDSYVTLLLVAGFWFLVEYCCITQPQITSNWPYSVTALGLGFIGRILECKSGIRKQ